MKKFSFGTIIGVSSLILVPLLALAASSSSTGSGKPSRGERPVPSQACIQAQVAKEDLMLSTMDATAVARRAAIQTRRDAFSAAASIVDDVQRQAAIKKANDDFQTAMKALIETKSTEMKAAMDAVRTACAGQAGGKGGKGGPEFNQGFGGGFGGGRMMGEQKGMRGRHEGGQKSSETSSD